MNVVLNNIASKLKSVTIAIVLTYFFGSKWHFCTPQDKLINGKWRHEVPNPDCESNKAECSTISGAAPYKPCIFPFKWKKTWHYYCIRDEDGAWCSTAVDASGNHLGGQGKWGNCGPGCPMPHGESWLIQGMEMIDFY